MNRPFYEDAEEKVLKYMSTYKPTDYDTITKDYEYYVNKLKSPEYSGYKPWLHFVKYELLMLCDLLFERRKKLFPESTDKPLI